MNGDPAVAADEFVMSAFIGVLEPAPSADVINQNCVEIGLTTLDVIDQPLQGVAALDFQSTLSRI